jgi:hypothetical protein
MTRTETKIAGRDVTVVYFLRFVARVVVGVTAHRARQTRKGVRAVGAIKETGSLGFLRYLFPFSHLQGCQVGYLPRHGWSQDQHVEFIEKY